MNQTRKKKLKQYRDALDKLKSNIESMRDDGELATLCDEEREQYEAMSEKAQESEKGVQIADNVSNLEAAMEELDAAIDSLDSALGSIFNTIGDG